MQIRHVWNTYGIDMEWAVLLSIYSMHVRSWMPRPDSNQSSSGPTPDVLPLNDGATLGSSTSWMPRLDSNQGPRIQSPGVLPLDEGATAHDAHGRALEPVGRNGCPGRLRTYNLRIQSPLRHQLRHGASDAPLRDVRNAGCVAVGRRCSRSWGCCSRRISGVQARMWNFSQAMRRRPAAGAAGLRIS